MGSWLSLSWACFIVGCALLPGGEATASGQPSLRSPRVAVLNRAALDQALPQQHAAQQQQEEEEEEESDDEGGMYGEDDVLVVMEFAGLGRAAAIELLREFGGDTEAVLASMYP